MTSKCRVCLIGIAIVMDILILKLLRRFVEIDKYVVFIISLFCLATLFKVLEACYLIIKTKNWKHGCFGAFALDGMLTFILFAILTDETVVISREIWVPICMLGFILFFILFAITQRMEKF